MNAQLLQAFRYVSRNILQEILGQVESLQIDQRRKGLGMNDGDLVVDQDECLKKKKRHSFRNFMEDANYQYDSLVISV